MINNDEMVQTLERPTKKLIKLDNVRRDRVSDMVNAISVKMKSENDISIEIIKGISVVLENGSCDGISVERLDNASRVKISTSKGEFLLDVCKI